MAAAKIPHHLRHVSSYPSDRHFANVLIRSVASQPLRHPPCIPLDAATRSSCPARVPSDAAQKSGSDQRYAVFVWRGGSSWEA